jgi:hypothetical protein
MHLEIEEVFIDRHEAGDPSATVVAKVIHPGRTARVVATDWGQLTLVELRAIRAEKAERATVINRVIAGLKDGRIDSEGRSREDLAREYGALVHQLATLKRMVRARQEAPVGVDAGKALGDMDDTELLAYADEIDEDIGDLKQEVADAQGLRALAMGEIGRRKLAWRAKH